MLIKVGLLAGALLTKVSLVGSLLRQIVGVFISKLRLIQILVEVGLGEVVGAIVGVQIVAVDVVGVDVIPVDVVGVDVIAIDVVNVRIVVIVAVIVIAVNECAGIGNIGIVVVHNRVVVPADVPRVPSPTAAPATTDGGSDGDA